MILLAAAIVVIIVVVIVGLALDLTLLRSPGVGWLLAIGGGGLLVLAGGAVLVLGVGGGSGDEDTPAESKARTTETRPTTTITTATTGTTATRGSALDAREVAVHASPRDDFAPFPSVVDRLPRRAVLLVTVTGFGPGATGLIEQCTATGCGNPFPVMFGDDGAARLQYLVGDQVQTGQDVAASCHPDDPPCIVRVSSGGTAAFLATVFGGPARPAPTVTVDAPDGEFVAGRAVRVVVAGFVPGEHVQAMLCAAPASYGTRRCGAPSAVAPITVDANGRGRTALVIGRGRVGTEGVSCSRETKCGVAVARAGSSVPGPVVVVTFAAGPSATYDSARLLSGLLIAGLLLLLACVLVRATDWRKPTEADTPELDRAVLVE